MRVSSLGVARPAYYDRNGQSIVNLYYAGAAPHAITTRWTYTVGAGKKLLVESQSTRLVRYVAATAAGQYHAEIGVSSGVSGTLTCQAHSIDNAITNQYFVAATTQVTIFAGESVSGSTYDTSTGGNVEYYVSFKGTLFDA
jgi:hypothetical protein